MKLKGKNVLVIGMGISGKSAYKFLKEKGAKVSFYDDNISEYDGALSVTDITSNYSLVVVSPGINVFQNIKMEPLIKAKVPIISELELGLNFCKGKIIAITGTNGKTTTVSLIGKILQNAKRKVFVCGNIGMPVTSIASKTSRKSYVVCEVSSFMLENSVISPYISCILNVSEDHLDRHKTFDNYLEIKTNIYLNQRKGYLILNFDDDNLMRLKPPIKTIYFSRNYITNGAYSSRGRLYYKEDFIMSSTGVKLVGPKNIENVLAAISVCSLLKLKPDEIKEGISNFYPLKHRLEPVGCKCNVMFIDDSKATNTDGTISALKAFQDSPLLLLGGKNKDLTFKPIFNEKFKKIYAFGEAGLQIYEEAYEANVPVSLHKNMKEAVLCAFKEATLGDTILLSPACASFDEFIDYADRGEAFKKIFLELSSEEKN